MNRLIESYLWLHGQTIVAHLRSAVDTLRLFNISKVDFVCWHRIQMRISINHSSLTDLKRLRGVGSVMAARIIAERQIYPFADCEDLQTRVKGITARTVRSWIPQTDVEAMFVIQNNWIPFRVNNKDIFLGAAFMSALITFALSLPKMYSVPANTIYFECIDDNDCGVDESCFPGEFRYNEPALYNSTLYNNIREYEDGQIWMQSKFGLEQVDLRYAMVGMMEGWESGRRCWSISNHSGDVCGMDNHRVCDVDANLSCIYGKCRKTDDKWLLNPLYMMGIGLFKSDKDLQCNSLKDCLMVRTCD